MVDVCRSAEKFKLILHGNRLMSKVRRKYATETVVKTQKANVIVGIVVSMLSELDAIWSQTP